jgi:hypothetical protein
MAASYFLKAAEINLTESNWHRLWIALALAGVVVLLAFERRQWPLLLLWAPLLFYALTVGYSGVPIFMPPWWPFSLYNVRYGIELLPAVAVFSALLVMFGVKWLQDTRFKVATVAVAALLVTLSYASVWRSQPVSFREGLVNSRTRIALETELARHLDQFSKNATFLMYLGDHVGALEQAGIPLRRVINEGNHRTWRQPADPDGLWEKALQNPAGYADYVVSTEGDEVATLVNRQGLTSVLVLHVSGQKPVAIYATHRQ